MRIADCLLDILRHVANIRSMKVLMNPSIAEIEAALAISEAEVARGETVPLAPILKRLHDRADRLEAKVANTRGQRATSRP